MIKLYSESQSGKENGRRKRFILSKYVWNTISIILLAVLAVVPAASAANEQPVQTAPAQDDGGEETPPTTETEEESGEGGQETDDPLPEPVDDASEPPAEGEPEETPVEENPAPEGETQDSQTEGSESAAPESSESTPQEEPSTQESEQTPPAEENESPAEEAQPEAKTEPAEEPQQPAEELQQPAEESQTESEATSPSIVLADTPVDFTALDNFSRVLDFESAAWEPLLSEGDPIVTVENSSNHPSLGKDALKINIPITPLSVDADLNANSVSWTRNFVTPLDWSQITFITLDVYAEQQLAVMPNLQISFSNEAGSVQTTRIIEAQEIKQWENENLIFRMELLDDSVLSEITSITITAFGYNDGVYGPAQEQLNLHIDNFRLNGSALWESFESSDYVLQPSESENLILGISNQNSYNNSTGSLILDWNENTSGTVAATFNTANIQDWSNYSAVRARVFTSEIALPMRLSFGDGVNTISSPPVTVDAADSWTDVFWTIPFSENFASNNISSLILSVDGIQNTAGTIFIDDIEAVRSVQVPYNVSVVSTSAGNEISWSNPLVGDANGITIMAGINDFPMSINEGEVVCQVAILSATGMCTHIAQTIEPNEAYYYTVIATGGTANSFDTASQAIPNKTIIPFSPAGANFEVGINQDNGALEYIKHVSSGEIVSQGNMDDALWALKFFNEDTLPMLTSADFSASSNTANFSLNAEEGVLTYTYDNDGVEGAELSVRVTLSGVNSSSFDWNMLVENDTGLTIRKVSMPHKITFDKAALERVYVPAWEGLTLEPSFFLENRFAIFGRSQLFADMVAVEQNTHNLALYAIQDSSFQANEIPGHDPANPVLQPADYKFGGDGVLSYVDIEVGTAIASGQQWNSHTLRFQVGSELDDVLENYLTDNNFDQLPTLAEKDVMFGQFNQLAASPLLTVDAFEVSQRDEVETGQTWNAIQDNLLGTLPDNAIVQFIRWQNGRINAEGNAIAPSLNQDLPTSSIWTEQYGPVEDIQSLLEAINTGGLFSAPYLDWTVWNIRNSETGRLPNLADTRDALRTSTASQPVILDNGYVLKSWTNDTRTRNDAILSQYSTRIPVDIIFSELEGANSWRYTYLDDTAQASASAYTQGIINETSRLGVRQPLIVGNMMDHLGAEAMGLAGSLRQVQQTSLLRPLGQQYVDWNAYPLAAMMLHEHVAFYPNPIDAARPTDSRANFTYYTLMGYSLADDATDLTGDRAFWMPMLGTFQEVINSRTFGQPMTGFEVSAEDNGQITSTWGSGRDKLTIHANLDPRSTGEEQTIDGYTISPDGFHAYSAGGNVIGGIYQTQFNGNPLTDGRHWITVEHAEGQIKIRQVFGADTDILVDRPRNWKKGALIQAVQVMDNGRALALPLTELQDEKILLSWTNAVGGLGTDRVIVFYNAPNGTDFELVSSFEELFAENEIVEEAAPAETTQEETTVQPEASSDAEASSGSEAQPEGQGTTEETSSEETSTEADSVGEPATEEQTGSEDETTQETPPAPEEQATDGEAGSEEASESGGSSETPTNEGATTEEQGESTPPETSDEAPPGEDIPPTEGESSEESTGGDGN
ncbi:MAG: hypothetical protein AAGD96_02125 [Chloroflexota bacterium]